MTLGPTLLKSNAIRQIHLVRICLSRGWPRIYLNIQDVLVEAPIYSSHACITMTLKSQS